MKKGTKKGKHWFNQLTTSQKIKYKENRRQQRNHKGALNEMLEINGIYSVNDFLMSSFTWYLTIQGHDYWAKIK